MGKKYYAIKNGRIPGIYETWDEAKKQIDGFKGAVYKSFTNINSAKEYMGYKIKGEEKKFKEGVLYIFTDGSYNTKTKKSAYGFYIPELKHIYVDTNKETNNYNEMLSILKALEFVKEIGVSSDISIHSDSEYAIKLIKNNYKKWLEEKKVKDTYVHKDILKEIYEMTDSIEGNIELNHVRSHTNNLDDFSKGNEVIDKAVQERTS